MSPTPEAPSRTAEVARWINEARGGDRAALGHLVQTFQRYLLVVAERELGSALRARVASSDLVQNTFLEAFQGFPTFRGSTKQQWKAWLRRILRNNLAHERRRHHARKRDLRREISLADTPPAELHDRAIGSLQSPCARMQAREREEGLERALQRLPDHYRKVLLLYQWEGLTFAQIGERMACTAEAARGTYRRARDELATLLGCLPQSQRRPHRFSRGCGRSRRPTAVRPRWSAAYGPCQWL